MFTTDLTTFETQHQELIRRAEHHRQLKSLGGSTKLSGRITRMIGKLMVNLGQQLVSYAQAAH